MAVSQATAISLASATSNIPVGPVEPYIFRFMPSFNFLQAIMAADAVRGVIRPYILPYGTIEFLGPLTFSSGQSLFGMGGDYLHPATTIVLDAGAYLQLEVGAGVGGLSFAMNAGATFDAVQSAGGAFGGKQRMFLDDVSFTGGNSSVWGIHLRNASEVTGRRIYSRSMGGGILLDTTDNAPANPGDSYFSDVRCWLLGAATAGVRISGQTGGAILTRSPNDTQIDGLYVNSAQANGGAWQTAGCYGLDIINAVRITAAKVNMEECQYDLHTIGGVGGGISCATIRVQGECNDTQGNGIVIDANCPSVRFDGFVGMWPRVDSSSVLEGDIISTSGVANSSNPFSHHTHIRGPYQSAILPLESVVTSDHTGALSANRAMRSNGSNPTPAPRPGVVPMASTDGPTTFAGVTPFSVSAPVTGDTVQATPAPTTTAIGVANGSGANYIVGMGVQVVGLHNQISYISAITPGGGGAADVLTISPALGFAPDPLVSGDTVQAAPAPTTVAFGVPNGHGASYQVGMTVRIVGAHDQTSVITVITPGGGGAADVLTVAPALGFAPSAGDAVTSYDTVTGRRRAYVASSGVVQVQCNGAVAVGDYLGLDPVDATGRCKSLGATQSTAQCSIGTALTSQGAIVGTVYARLRPTEAAVPTPTGGAPTFNQSGMYLFGGLQYSTGLRAVNQLEVLPFYLAATTSLQGIGIYLVTGQIGGAYRFVIYADNGHGFPGAIVFDSGDVACLVASSASIVEFNAGSGAPVTGSAFPFSLNTGLYWIGGVDHSSGINITLNTCTVSEYPLPLVAGSMSSVLANTGYVTTGVAGAPPSPWVSTNVSSGTARVALHVS